MTGALPDGTTGVALQDSATTSHGTQQPSPLALPLRWQEHFPEVQAVASGAIASDYQRLRVEEVR